MTTSGPLRRCLRRWQPARTRNRPHERLLRVESLECRQLLAGDLVLTELMAANDSTLYDSDGDTPDWIEIHNAGTNTLNLAGWTLTDDAGNLGKWEFPARTIAPDQYLVVFASGKDRAVAEEDLHTNFKLRAAGEYVALVAPTGVVVSEFGPAGSNYPPQYVDISYGATPAGTRYFMQPTPGAVNGPGQTGVVSAPAISVEHGFFTAPFTVEIATATPGATVYYTTDGSMPTASHGEVYSGPLGIDRTTTLRTAAFKQDMIPAPVETRTYLFPADVLQQDSRGLGGEAWGHAGPDWEVDPEIVHHPDPASRLVVDDLLAIPTVSLVMNADDMFGSNGIYIRGENVEKATSVELLNPDGSDGFQTDASVQIVGGSSTDRWKSDKLSMRLKFNEEFGSGDLQYPAFGDEAATSFDTLVLDAHLNNAWHYGGTHREEPPRAQYLRDQFTADLQLAVGGYAPHDKHVHLYINGIYWGMYRLHERPDDNFAAAYLGGNNDDYDVIKHNPTTVVHGSNQSYLKLLAATRLDMTDADNYQAVVDLLDVDDFIDYMLVNFYVGNTDWAHQNWYATYNHVDPNGRWRFHSWDAELTMDHVFRNVTHKNDPGGPTEIHRNLMANPEYWLRFADHVHRHFFNDGVLTPAAAAARYQVRLDQIDRAVVAESARWGDNHRDIPYTRGVEWVHERDRLLNEYFPQRTQTVIDQLKLTGDYPAIEAPELNQHGGRILTSFDLELLALEGTIYYTTDGTDPRLAGGAVAPGAVEFTGPFRLPHSGIVKARVLRDNQWSALNEAEFVVQSELPLRITEINYDPHVANQVPGLGELVADNDRFEFIELMNVGGEAIDLGGVRLAETAVAGNAQGIDFSFASQVLTPGERLVVVRDRDAFESRYGTGPRIALGHGGSGIDGQYDGKLSNRGEQLTLLDAAGAIIHQFAYGVSDAWPDRAAGWGSTLEVIDTGSDYGNPDNWRASSDYGGSPGSAGAGPNAEIVVNEVLSRGVGGEADQIELYNRTDHAVDLSRWYLSDDLEDLLKSSLPPGTTVGTGQYLTLDPAAYGFGLSGTQGDDVWLIEADANGRPTRFVDHVRFAATDIGVALGRWPNGDPRGTLVPMISPSFGSANAGPVAGELIVSEMYAPPRSPLILMEDFEDGTAVDFKPILGTWVVRDGGYQVTPGPESDTVATITTGQPLPADFAFSATLRARVLPDFSQNGVLVFDYHGPTDFKFVSMHPVGNKWKIGYRDASGWNFVEKKAAPIETNRDIDVRLEVRGSLVILATQGVILSHDFATPLNAGHVGVGSRGGTPRFEQVKLERLKDLPDLRFLELANPTTAPMDLAGWRLQNTVAMTFAAGTTLGAGEALVAVGFDPGNPEKLAMFRQAFGIDESVTVVGPYVGNLHTGDGIVRLLKPGLPAAGALVLVDQVTYADRFPWPAQAGHGRALSRATAASFGSSASSWSALVPTPGTARFALTGDLDFDGDVDTEDVRGFVLAMADPSAYRAAYGVPALMVADADRDGDVDFDDIAGFAALLAGPSSSRNLAVAGKERLPGRSPHSRPVHDSADRDQRRRRVHHRARDRHVRRLRHGTVERVFAEWSRFGPRPAPSPERR